MAIAMASKGPPYAPTAAGFGGRPDTKIDVGVSALFIALFGIFGILHMSIFRRNKAAGHFFIFNGVCFGFCMSRITTFVMRIEWAQNPTSISIAIAANVFVSAGVILLYVINMNFCQRTVRGYHPRFYNSKLFKNVFLAYYISLVAVLIMVIVTTVQSFYTLNHSVLKADMNVRKFGVMWFLIFCFAPIPITLAAIFMPSTTEPQNFGKKGSLKTKAITVIIVSAVLTLSTGVRAASTLGPLRPSSDPAWYNKRAAFYVFLATLEVFVVAFLAVMRVDQRFFVPGKAEAEREADTESKSSEGTARQV
ncbi:hypothetical protein DFP73DRAFT_552826 [Morchella snyderi]|nr:hypothetical protein DFP73DRAFT_552826 [Morchella snyderi]